MATREVVTLVCDRCGKSEDEAKIETHTVYVDGVGMEAEVCNPCWGVALRALYKIEGRAPTVKKVTQRKNIVEWPGEEWRFTNHALVRMGERHVSPADVIEVVENATNTRPAREPGLEVRSRYEVKAVVNVEKRIVLTVAKRDEEEERVA